MNHEDGLQQHFFNAVRQKLPAYISLVHEVAETLGISYDSAYRRLRGEKDLSILEMKKLSSKFGISIDSLFEIENLGVSFHPFELGKTENGFEALIRMIISQMSLLNGADKKEMILISRDLPIYYFFDFPELVAFKQFFWKKLLLVEQDYHDKYFEIGEPPQKLMALGQQLMMAFNRLPTIEVWNQETFTRLMQQITFCCASGFVKDKSEVIALFDALSRLIRHIQYQTELGCKFRVGEVVADAGENLMVYTNEVLLIDNLAFVNVSGNKTIFLTFNTLNILVTSDPDYCNQAEHSIRWIMKTGNHISGTSALECNRFFSKLFDKLEEFKTESINHRCLV